MKPRRGYWCEMASNHSERRLEAEDPDHLRRAEELGCPFRVEHPGESAGTRAITKAEIRDRDTFVQRFTGAELESHTVVAVKPHELTDFGPQKGAPGDQTPADYWIAAIATI